MKNTANNEIPLSGTFFTTLSLDSVIVVLDLGLSSGSNCSHDNRCVFVLFVSLPPGLSLDRHDRY